jgi:hypothetical protein
MPARDGREGNMPGIETAIRVPRNKVITLEGVPFWNASRDGL